jgi:hypothetical protein
MIKIWIWPFWLVNAVICTGIAIYDPSSGWLNSAIQVWLATITIYLLEARI